MVEQQTRVQESTAQDERRLQRLRGRHVTLLAAAVGLLVVGAVLLVSSFALLLRDRDEEPRGTTAARKVADQLAGAGLGCEDFNGSRPPNKGVIQEARCNTTFGTLRIVVYRTEDVLRNQQIFTRSYQCLVAAGGGRTKLISVVRDTIRLALPDENVAAAQAYRRAVGGKIVTTDCTAPPEVPPTATTTPPAPPPESVPQ